MAGFGSSGWGGNLLASEGAVETDLTISNLTPVAGTQILPNQAISFDVTSNVDISLVAVSVIYPQTGAAEAAWTGAEFTPNFVNGSTRLPVAGGYTFSISRRGGWPLDPQISAHAADAGGNTASL